MNILVEKRNLLKNKKQLNNFADFIFVHITKTGGTSIRRSINNSWRGGHITAQYIWDTQTDGKHLYFPEQGLQLGGTYATPYGNKIHNFNKIPLSLSIVRNPYDRLISTYMYLKNKEPNTKQYKSFNVWFDNNLGKNGKYVSDLLLLNNLSTTEQIQKFIKPTLEVDIGWMFLLPQYYHLTFNGKIVIKEILRFENLKEEFTRLIAKYKLEHVDLPHENKTEHNHYSTYFNNQQIEIVKQIYKKDFEVFGYKFDRVS
tara:strand:+ start:237 stop:1007 length:771 start_codon:yes stop_codon:yes gene_type:complete